MSKLNGRWSKCIKELDDGKKELEDARTELNDANAKIEEAKQEIASNINVAERIRELCTIKVLGFYDNEVTMYIYKETIFLSIIGVVVGWIIGILLHTYILVAVPPAEVMFDPKVTISSYIVPAVVIAFVTFVLKYYVNNRLKVVDMLEALKSVD